MQVILTMVFVKETRWMATLEELRGQLDVVDDQIVKLYEERMKICEQVGEYKVEAGRKVFDRVREKEKLQNVASKVSSDFDKKGIQELYQQLMQTELHPYHQEKELKAFLKENGIVAQSWYPLGHGDKALLEEPLFAELGKKYGKSSAQVILRWHIQDGNIVIPGSKNPTHIQANFDLFDFALTDEEMDKIAAMNKNARYYTSTPEMLKRYAETVPPVDEQK